MESKIDKIRSILNKDEFQLLVDLLIRGTREDIKFAIDVLNYNKEYIGSEKKIIKLEEVLKKLKLNSITYNDLIGIFDDLLKGEEPDAIKLLLSLQAEFRKLIQRLKKIDKNYDANKYEDKYKKLVELIYDKKEFNYGDDLKSIVKTISILRDNEISMMKCLIYVKLGINESCEDDIRLPKGMFKDLFKSTE